MALLFLLNRAHRADYRRTAAVPTAYRRSTYRRFIYRPSAYRLSSVTCWFADWCSEGRGARTGCEARGARTRPLLPKHRAGTPNHSARRWAIRSLRRQDDPSERAHASALEHFPGWIDVLGRQAIAVIGGQDRHRTAGIPGWHAHDLAPSPSLGCISQITFPAETSSRRSDVRH